MGVQLHAQVESLDSQEDFNSEYQDNVFWNYE